MIFKLYIDYNKHEMIKIGNETREKSPVTSVIYSKCSNNIDADSTFNPLSGKEIIFLMLINNQNF